MHVLLARTDRIGDLVLSTPAIATIRASFPRARVTIVCSPYNRVVVERSSDVDEIVEYPLSAKPGAFGAAFRGAVDIAIALAPRSTDLQIVGGTRAPVRAGYTYLRRYFARLTAPLYLNRLMLSEADPALCERHPEIPVRHEVDQLLDLVAMVGATQRVASIRVDVNDEDRAAISYLPADPIVMHLGQRWFKHGSTLASTIRLIGDLGRLGLPVVLTYAPESGEYVGAIAQARVADVMLGGLSFHRWAAVFERARTVVTVDTGATHVASAVRRPTVVAFEHRYFRLNSQEWAPYGVPNLLVRKPADESDASLAVFRREIVDAVARLLNA
ncbi:MAG: glycosyltransferase family 9 protein [Vulcanimicrobiaceae bacterium]